jgi:hypothetical protein
MGWDIGGKFGGAFTKRTMIPSSLYAAMKMHYIITEPMLGFL